MNANLPPNNTSRVQHCTDPVVNASDGDDASSEDIEESEEEEDDGKDL